MGRRHDWPGDGHLENGNYTNRCLGCEVTFTGHKGRPTCRVCHDKLAHSGIRPLWKRWLPFVIGVPTGMALTVLFLLTWSD